METLSTTEKQALNWALKEAETWRGLYTGDDTSVAEFDRRIKHAKNAVKKLRKLDAAQRARNRAYMLAPYGAMP